MSLKRGSSQLMMGAPPDLRSSAVICYVITKSYKNTIKTDDAIHASIIAECIKLRDNTMTCGTMQQCDANDIVMYLTTM